MVYAMKPPLANLSVVPSEPAARCCIPIDPRRETEGEVHFQLPFKEDDYLVVTYLDNVFTAQQFVLKLNVRKPYRHSLSCLMLFQYPVSGGEVIITSIAPLQAAPWEPVLIDYHFTGPRPSEWNGFSMAPPSFLRSIPVCNSYHH